MPGSCRLCVSDGSDCTDGRLPVERMRGREAPLEGSAAEPVVGPTLGRNRKGGGARMRPRDRLPAFCVDRPPRSTLTDRHRTHLTSTRAEMAARAPLVASN